MFWSKKPTYKSTIQKVTCRPGLPRCLRMESLEHRELLSGVVNVAIFPVGLPGTLTLTGDGSNNQVEIRQTNNVGEYIIDSPDDTLFQVNNAGVTMQQVTVNGISGNITVDLRDGNDSFTFGGIAQGDISNVPTNLTILNSDGSNTNILSNILVNGDLNVTKNPDSSGYSELRILGSTIIGDARINNIGNGTGDTKTLIDSSKLQGGGESQWALLLQNANGQDIVEVLGNSQFGTGPFVAMQPIVEIQNDGGGSRISFTGASQIAGPGTTTVYGALKIQNGLNLPGTLDMLTFNQTNILGWVDVTNFDGDTETMVLQSVLGSHLTPNGPGGSTSIFNGAGYDEFTMTKSEVPWGLLINNDFINQGQSTWGSSSQFTESKIGTRLFGPTLPTPGDALQILGDQGADKVNLNATVLGGTLNLGNLFNGNNQLQVSNGSSMAALNYIGGIGNDTVVIDDSNISVSVEIRLNAGADTLRITNIDPANQWPSPLLGASVLDGGLGVDTANLDALTLGALNFEIFAS